MTDVRILWRVYQQLRRAAFPKEWYAQAKRYREAHPARVRECKKQCRKTRLAHYQAKGREYRAIRRAIELTADVRDRPGIAKIYKRAGVLRQWFDVVVDHIIPLAKGGAHAPGNLQIIYRLENLHKNASLGYKPKVIFV
jgi:hypothetical protein